MGRVWGMGIGCVWCVGLMAAGERLTCMWVWGWLGERGATGERRTTLVVVDWVVWDLGVGLMAAGGGRLTCMWVMRVGQSIGKVSMT